MKSIINKLLGRTNTTQRPNDLTPRGIRSTVKSETHGTNEDFNKTWFHIGSQLRNLDSFIEEYNKTK